MTALPVTFKEMSTQESKLEEKEDYHAFILYDSKDYEKAKELLDLLESHGFKCLFDDRDFMVSFNFQIGKGQS